MDISKYRVALLLKINGFFIPVVRDFATVEVNYIIIIIIETKRLRFTLR